MKLDEVTAEKIIQDGDITQTDEATIGRSKGELFSVLTLWTKGEPNQIVRGVLDQDGFVAWKKLYDRYNPRTPASLTAAWREVIKTKKVRDLREADKTMDVWEAKVERLKREHGEEVPEGLKAALLMEMLPENVQMTVAQGMSKKFDYDALKAKIRLMASVHTEMSTPQPMEVDALQEQQFDWEHGGGEWGEVDAVAKGKGRGSGPMFGSCWTCGGPHFSNECPKNGQSEKGGKGGAKSAGKGDAIGKGKGKGKLRTPMYGSCWICGGPHFQADCPQGQAQGASGKGGGKSKGKGKSLREVEEESEEEAEDVGGVTECWSISGVDVARHDRLGRWRKALGRRTVRLANRFFALSEVNEVSEKGEGDGQVKDNWVTCQNCPMNQNGVYCKKCVAKENCRQKFDYVDGDDGHVGEYIQDVAEGGDAGRGEIVIDSGAAESVCPWNWANAFPTREVPWGQKRQFRNASGGKMGHYGEKRVRGSVNGMDAPISMLFQVSDARNPLASVARITERGNLVQFGPRDADNYIFNPDTGDKVMLRKKGNKFVLDLDFSGRA